MTSSLTPVAAARMLASVRREERTIRRIYKDILSFNNSLGLLDSKRFYLSERISRLVEEHRRIIGSIAAKKEALMRSACVLNEMDTRTETSSRQSGTTPCQAAEEVSKILQQPIPDATLSPDIPYCETPSPLQCLEHDLTFESIGFMDSQELANLGWLTNDSPTPSLRSP